MLKKYLNKKILLFLFVYLIISIFLYFSSIANVKASVINSSNGNSIKYYYGPSQYVLLDGFKPSKSSSQVDFTHIRYKPLNNLEGTEYFKYVPFYNNISSFSYKFKLNSTSSDMYLSSLELFQRLAIEDSYIDSQSSCVQRFTDLFLNFYVHQLWSFYIDYDYDNEKFEPIEWLSSMISYNGNFHGYSSTEKIIKKDDKIYREIVFSVTILPYYYSYDSNGELIVDPNDYKSYISYNKNANTCDAILHYQFDFLNLSKAHQFSIGPISANSGSYLQMNKMKISTSSIDYYVLEDYQRPSDLEDFEEIEEFPTPQPTGVKAILNFFENAWNDFKNDVNLFFNRLKLAFVSLFVPNESVLTYVYTTLQVKTQEQFGFLLTPIALFKDIISRFNNLSASNMVVNIPDIKVPNFDFVIIPKTSFSFTDLLTNNSTMNKLWILYLDFVDVYLILSFLNLSWNKLNSVFGGMISENEYLSVEDVESYDNTTGEFKGSTRRVSKSRRKRRRIK